MPDELLQNYLLAYDRSQRTNFGFYSLLGNEVATMMRLSMNNAAPTGADMYEHILRTYAVAIS